MDLYNSVIVTFPLTGEVLTSPESSLSMYLALLNGKLAIYDTNRD